MRTFLARWPNGDVSFIAAQSEELACRLLDEVGSPFDVQLIPLNEPFIGVHFKLMDTGELELDEMSESLRSCLPKALPIIDAAQDELFDANIEMNSDYWKERMRKAVQDERAREYPCNAEAASARGLGFDKGLDDDGTWDDLTRS